MARRRLRRVKRRKARANPKRRKRRVRRNAWPKGKSVKRSRAAKRGWAKRRAKKARRSAAARKAGRKRKRRTTAAKPRRRTRATSRRRRKGWKRQKSDHSIAAKIGWAGRKRRRSSSYVRKRGVKKKKLRSYRRRHKPARRRKTRVSYWGKVAANPRRRRRRKSRARRNPRRRSRRRSSRRVSYNPVRYNPGAGALSLKGFQASVKEMFKTDFLKGMAQIAGGSLAVGVADAYLGDFIESKLGIRSRIADATGAYASKALYVYDNAFTLAVAGALGYGAGAVCKMAGCSDSTRRKVQTSIAMGGALVVMTRVVTDVVALISEKTGLGLGLSDYASLPMSDYATGFDMMEAPTDVRDFATLSQVAAAPALGALDFEYDTSGVAQMNDYIYQESF